MAQTYPRRTLSVFGKGGTTDDFEQFGSTAIAATNYTKDIATIQTLDAWTNGWRPALVTAKAPILQDMNAVQYVHSYMQGSLFEEGIPEWDAGTTYAWGSVVKLPYTGGNNFQIFISLADANLNNALPTAPASNASWKYVFGFVSGVFTMGSSIAFGDTSTEGIVGSPTNDSAAAGNVGQYVESVISPATNAPTTGQYGDITSISLTAGDWDVSLLMDFISNGGTITDGESQISTVSGNNGSGAVNGVNAGRFAITIASPNNHMFVAVPSYRMSLSGTTTVYAKTRVSYSAAQAQIACRISARRMR